MTSRFVLRMSHGDVTDLSRRVRWAPDELPPILEMFRDLIEGRSHLDAAGLR